MKEVFTEITINSSAEEVWRILLDVEAYGTWNPFIAEAHGKAELGERLVCRPILLGGIPLKFGPTVTRLEPERVFAWSGRIITPSLGAGEHIFELYPQDDGSVHHVHRMVFSGALTNLMGKRILKTIERGFINMNEALKDVAENAV